MVDRVQTKRRERHPSAAYLRTLVEQAPDAIFVVDKDGRYTFINRTGCRLLGYARKEIVGKNVFDLVPAEDVDRFLNFTAQILRGACHVAEWRLRRKDGTWLPVEVNAKILRDGRWHGFMRDISKRKASEAERNVFCQQVDTEGKWLRTVLDTLPVGVWVADRTGRIVSNNPAGERIWKGARYVPVAEAGQYKGWWVDTGKPIAAEEWALARAVRQGETSRGELIRIQCFDGSFRTVINWAAPIRSDTGEVIGAVAVNEDVTSLQQTQEQLRAAVRDREEILAIVAHDLRNPLTGLMLGASAVEQSARKLPGGEPVRELAATLVDISRRMSGLVEDLLAVAVATTGGGSMLKLERVSAANFVVRAAEAAQPLFASKGLELELNVASKLPQVNADADRIHRVFANLLDNALKFTSPPGRVTLAAERIAGGVRFSVANSGPALPSKQRRAMFRPFWQARRDRRGAGMGLSICRSIVEAHGGSIWAEPAKGQRVRVCFVLLRQAASS